jgi:hypothetical protein
MACEEIRDNYIHINQVGYLKHNYTNDFNKDRKELRDKIIDLFKSENAGQGKGSLATRVVYCVEDINGEIIYLKRPAPLNNGFDFEVHTKSKLFFGRIKTRPSHECIKKIIRDLKSQNISIYNSVQIVIDELYNCEESNLSSIQFTINNNITVEILLRCIKWLFVEQDITYWSYSGREMLYKGLKSV